MAFDTDVVDDSVEVDAPQIDTEEVNDEEAQAEPTQTTESDDSEEQTVDDDSEGREPDDKPEPKKNRASDRIQQLVAEKKELEAKYAQLSEQSQQPKQAQSTDGAPVKPNIDDYDLDTQLDDYFAAQAEYDSQLDEWKFDQRLQQREQAKQQAAKQQEVTDSFTERFTANPKFRDDFEQLATLMQDKPIQADPSQLYAGDDLMDILEHVAADQNLYYELADMTEQRQYAEFGRIHAQIQSRKSAPKANRQSKAPPPPNHTKANAPMKRDQYSGSDDEVMRARGL